MALHTGPIHDALATPLAEQGLVVEDIRAHTAGRHRTLTVIVDLDADHAEPVSSQAVADATRTISALLDGLDVWGDHPYTLEVSSPGAERPLTQPRQFRRSVGRRLRAELSGAGTGEDAEAVETVEATLVSADEDGIVLEDVRAGGRIPYAQVRAARVVVSLR
jgi:ribosome maturation factor RimP